jgi:hypothetical protein
MRNQIADVVLGKLSTHLGPHVARVAIKTFSQKAAARKPEELTQADVPNLLEAMRPMLAVMIGKEAGQVALDEIARELR